MSLINKMLIDLEERQACLAGEQDVALQGISSVNDDAFHQRPGSSTRIIFSFLLLILFGVLIKLSFQYFTPGNFAERSKQDKVLTVEAVPEQAETAREIQQQSHPGEDQEIAAQKIAAQLDAAGISLKLDEFVINSLPPAITLADKPEVSSIQPGPEVAAGKTVITNFNLSSEINKTIFHIGMAGNPEYVVYALNDPERIVVEINNIQDSASLPKSQETKLVSSVRARFQGNDRAIIVLDMKRPSFVQESSVLTDPANYGLSVTIISEPEEKNIPALNPTDAELDNQINDSGLAQNNNIPEKSPVTETRGMVKTLRTSAEYYQDGLHAYQGRNIAAALDLLIEAIIIDPRHIEARTTLASVLIENGNADMAIDVLREGLEIFPAQYAWAKTLAHLLVDKGRLADAVATLQQRQPAMEQDIDYHAFLAALLQQQGKHEQAAALYRKLVERNNRNGVWWMGLGISLEAETKKSEAGYAYRRALGDSSLKPELRKFVTHQLSRL